MARAFIMGGSALAMHLRSRAVRSVCGEWRQAPKGELTGDDSAD
jgi:hypothetical protein